MSFCDCTICRRDRISSVVANYPEPTLGDILRDALEAQTPKPSVRFTDVRDAVENYYRDVTRWLDFSTLRADYEGGAETRFSVTGRSFADVSGFQHLGNGAYADVYALDDKRALKIVKTSDSGYARFAKICRENRGNPHLPRIMATFEAAGKQCYIFERLTGDSSRRANQTKEHLRDAMQHSGRNPFIVVTEAIAQIAKLLPNMNDLHNGNIMFRGDVPVITDPYS